MKKISALLASLPLITTACGSGGSDSTSVDSDSGASTTTLDLSQEKGIWSSAVAQTFTSPSGNVTTLQPSTGLVTSQEQMIILTGNSDLYVVNAGSGQSYYFRAFAFLTEITSATSTQSNGDFVFDYFNEKREVNEQIKLPANGHYDVAIDLSTMNGTWIDEYNNNNWSFSINADSTSINTNATFTATLGGCNATGTLSHIDNTKSELSVSITFGSNCGTNLKNTFTGLAWPDVGDPTGLFNMAAYSSLDTSGKAIGWKLRKQ